MRGYVIKARDSKQRYVIPIDVNYSTLRMTEGTLMEESNELSELVATI
jgi:hypothetical protein